MLTIAVSWPRWSVILELTTSIGSSSEVAGSWSPRFSTRCRSM